MGPTSVSDYHQDPHLNQPNIISASEIGGDDMRNPSSVLKGLDNAPEQDEIEQLALPSTTRTTRLPPITSQMIVHADKAVLPWENVISASQFDPFSTLPIQVDQVTNELLHFYTTQSYWQTAYALSPKIKLSIKGSWEKHAEVCVSHFHILMARSALHQLHVNKYAPPKAQKRLELAALKHQSEAVTNLRRQVSYGPKADRKEILTSVISFATFEKRYGNPEKALIHFKAGRDIFRQIGKQDGINDLQRVQQALWFEGIYADPGASFMWDKEDANTRLGWLNELLGDVDRIWRNRQLLPLKTRKPLIATNSRLHEFLARDTEGKMISAYGDISETIAQQRCMIIFLSVITQIHRQGVGGIHSKTGSESKTVTSAIQSYSSWVEDMLVKYDLNKKDAEADLLWLMLQDFQIVKPRSPKLAALDALDRPDLRDIHWRACGMANVVKYLPSVAQTRLKSSLLAFVEGKRYGGKLTLDELAFSYAST